eukprot:2705563-Rhodomonas_salina.1
MPPLAQVQSKVGFANLPGDRDTGVHCCVLVVIPVYQPLCTWLIGPCLQRGRAHSRLGAVWCKAHTSQVVGHRLNVSAVRRHTRRDPVAMHPFWTQAARNAERRPLSPVAQRAAVALRAVPELSLRASQACFSTQERR